MCFVRHQTEVRSQSLMQTGVIVADIYMLTHCQQEKRGRREGKLWQVYRMLGEGKKKCYWT